MRRVAVTVLVLALLGGTVAAFTVTEVLKLERSPLAAPRFDAVFSPTCGCPTQSARLSFRLRGGDRLDLVIVSDNEPVRTLARDLDRPSGRVRIRWDGRDDAGAIVPDGVYHLRVHMDDARRTIVVPNEIRVDTEGPALEVVDAKPAAFSPDGDGRRDALTIVYRTDGPAQAFLFVHGRPAFEGPMRRAGERKFVWGGTVDGRPLGEGDYRLFMRLRDRAGNVSSPISLSVQIRYLDVVPGLVVARRGTRLAFHVRTDAATVAWTLVNRRGGRVLARGRAQPGSVTVRLPGRIRPGHYILEVAANMHRDYVAVRILKRAG